MFFMYNLFKKAKRKLNLNFSIFHYEKIVLTCKYNMCFLERKIHWRLFCCEPTLQSSCECISGCLCGAKDRAGKRKGERKICKESEREMQRNKERKREIFVQPHVECAF